MRRFLVSLFVTLALFALAMSVAFAADAFSGTWKMNIAKSTPTSTPPNESLTQRIQVIDNGMNLVQDGVNPKGQKTHGEWTVKFDGKQYPVKLMVDGKPDPDYEGETVSATKSDDHTLSSPLLSKEK
jgi:hypothetical protein